MYTAACCQPRTVYGCLKDDSVRSGIQSMIISLKIGGASTWSKDVQIISGVSRTCIRSVSVDEFGQALGLLIQNNSGSYRDLRIMKNVQ